MSIHRGAGDSCAVSECLKEEAFESPRKATAVTFKTPWRVCLTPRTPRPPKQLQARTSRSQCRMAPSLTERAKRRPSLSPGPMKNRRAISLENLATKKSRPAHLVHQQATDKIRHQKQELVSTERNQENIEFNRDSARRICQVLILNAWRKERNRVKTLTQENALTVSRVEDYKKQTSALRQLLEAEKDRMSKATLKVHELSDLLDNSSAKIDEIFQQKDEREAKLVDFEIKIVKLETNNESQIENYRTTQAFYDKQEKNLAQEKRILEEMTRGNQLLDETIANDEKKISKNKDTIQKMTKRVSQMQIELLKAIQNVAACKAKQKARQEKNQELKEENEQLSNKLEQSLRKRDLLLQQIKISKMVIEEKEARSRDLENDVLEKEHDIMFLRQQLLEFQLQESGQSWKKQARDLARSIRPLVIYLMTHQVTY